MTVLVCKDHRLQDEPNNIMVRCSAKCVLITMHHVMTQWRPAGGGQRSLRLQHLSESNWERRLHLNPRGHQRSGGEDEFGLGQSCGKSKQNVRLCVSTYRRMPLSSSHLEFSSNLKEKSTAHKKQAVVMHDVMQEVRLAIIFIFFS